MKAREVASEAVGQRARHAAAREHPAELPTRRQAAHHDRGLGP